MRARCQGGPLCREVHGWKTESRYNLHAVMDLSIKVMSLIDRAMVQIQNQELCQVGFGRFQGLHGPPSQSKPRLWFCASRLEDVS